MTTGTPTDRPIVQESPAPTRHARLLAWVEEVAELTQPDRIHWVDGSDAEYAQLTSELVEAGTVVRLNDEKKPVLGPYRPQ